MSMGHINKNTSCHVFFLFFFVVVVVVVLFDFCQTSQLQSTFKNGGLLLNERICSLWKYLHFSFWATLKRKY